MNVIEVRISDITISDRFRKEMGDLKGLALSINEGELLQPIGITPDHELVFGERRLRACRDIIGRETIPARIVDVHSMLLGQIDENVLRKDFTFTERIAIVDSLRSFQHGGDRRSDQARNSSLGSLSLANACKFVGLSEDTYRRAKFVTDNGVPELAEAMDSGILSIHAAETLAKRASPEEQRECLTKPLNESRATARNVQKQIRRIRSLKQHEGAVAEAIEASTAGDTIQIHHCPFQKMEQVAGIEPESVQLICTDIPYGNDFVDQIEELSAFADRALVSGGTFVSYVGHHRLDEKIALLGRHLRYQWLGVSVWAGLCNDVPRLKLISKATPFVIFSKGRWMPERKWADTFINEDREKDWHPWQRPLAEIEKLVSCFSKPGDLVVDTCGGSFTTAIACFTTHRRFIGCDTDQTAVAKGRERLSLERRTQAVHPMAS